MALYARVRCTWRIRLRPKADLQAQRNANSGEKQRKWPNICPHRRFLVGLLRQITGQRHNCDIEQCRNAYCCQGHCSPVASAILNERYNQQDYAAETEGEHTQHFAVDKPHFCRDQLQCLEHENEKPFGPYACRRRSKWVCFFTQFPWKNGGES